MSSTPLLNILGSSGILLTAFGLGWWWLADRRLSEQGMSTRRSVFFWVLLSISLLGPLGVRLLTTPEAFDDKWIERAMTRYGHHWTHERP